MITKIENLLGDNKLLKRVDASSTTNRIYFGFNRRADALPTDNDWFIFAQDLLGDQPTAFAKNSGGAGVPDDDFVHIWANRVALFDGVAFLNEKSIITFGQADEYLSAAHTTDHNFGPEDPFSFVFNLKQPASGGGTEDIFHKMDGANNGYQAEIDGSGRLVFEFRGSGTGDRMRGRLDSLNARSGLFKNYVISKAGGAGSFAIANLSIWVDGVLHTVGNGGITSLNDTLSNSSPTDTNTDPLAIFSNNSGASRLTGWVDEFAILDFSLANTEAQEIYNSGGPDIDLESASANIANNLVSLWRMGDGSFVSTPNIPDEISGHTMVMQSSSNTGNIVSTVRPG